MDESKPFVLLIEDDETIRTMYERKFEHEGIPFLSTATGHEGLKLITEKHPALILLDVMLPDGINGFDILQIIKRDEAVKNIPVIMLTNLNSEEQTARDMGVKDYIVKADTPLESLVEKIRTYLLPQ